MDLGLDRFRKLLGSEEDLEDDAGELEENEDDPVPDAELIEELHSVMGRAEEVSGLENRIDLQEYRPDADLRIQLGVNGLKMHRDGGVEPERYTSVLYGDELLEVDDEELNTAKGIHVIMSDLDYRDRFLEDIVREYGFSEEMATKFTGYQERRTVAGGGVNYRPVMFDDALKCFLIEQIMGRQFEYEPAMKARVEKVRQDFREDESVDLDSEFTRNERQSSIQEYAGK